MCWNILSQNLYYDSEPLKRMNILREAINAYEKAYAKVTDAVESLMSDDKDTVWNTYQNYLCQYGERINSISPLTGIPVYRDSNATKDNLSLLEIKQRLNWIANFLLQYDALEFAANEEAKHAVESLLRVNGIKAF